MYAVVQTGGKQYRVSVGDVINVEKLNVEAGQNVVLNDVVAISGDGKTTIGKPFVEGAGVEAEVLENGKAAKVYTYKYKAKKDSKKKIGHRQPFTKLEIKAIKASGAKASAPAKKQEAKAEAPKAAEESVNLKALKKAELVDFAASKNIEVNAKPTKDEIIAAIEAALK